MTLGADFPRTCWAINQLKARNYIIGKFGCFAILAEMAKMDTQQVNKKAGGGEIL